MTTRKQYAVYGIGAALVDTELLVSDEDLQALNIDKGLMTLVDEARQAEILNFFSEKQATTKKASGGSAANSIIASSYFGSNCYFTGKVADDEDGHFYLNDMQAAGVKTLEQSQLETGITGKCLVLITPDAERSMNTFLGASETLSKDLLSKKAIEESNYIYIEGYLVTSPTGRATAEQARAIAANSHTKVAVSLSDPGIVAGFRDDLQNMFGDQVDLLFCNEEEALSWHGASNLTEAEEKLKEYAKHYAITLGAEGAIIWNGQQRYHVKGKDVNAIDTNGAGDMFAGAYIHGLTQGWDVEQAGEFACHAAGQVVSQYGPRLKAEQHSELLAALSNSN